MLGKKAVRKSLFRSKSEKGGVIISAASIRPSLAGRSLSVARPLNREKIRLNRKLTYLKE
jgi:hypothetical protein